MKNWKLASALLAVGYLFGTLVEFATFYISIIAMWVASRQTKFANRQWSQVC